MNKKSIFPLAIIILSAVAVTGSLLTVTTSARAVLMSPRLGMPVRGPATTGSGSSSQYIEEPFSIWVGTDRDAPVPASWLTAGNWHVGLVPNVLANAQGSPCLVVGATAGSSPLVAISTGDTSPLSQNAVRLDLRVQRSIQPGTYDLHVGFLANPLADLPASNDTAGLVLPGTYQGPAGSASGFASASFTLAEPNCVYIPWTNDSLVSSPVASPGPADYYRPWSLVHISDMHFGADETTGLQDPSSALFTNAVRDAISVMAPELVVMTGDLTRSPYDRPSEYDLARAWFGTLGIPAIISNGNHDSGNMGLFLRNFGPQAASISWGGTRFLTFRSDMPITAKTVSRIARDLHEASLAGHPSFLACHVPLVDVFARQAPGSAGAILDALVRENGTALLQGHNHYNLVMDAATALDRYLAFGTETGTIEDACEFTTLSGEALPAVDGPKLVITTTGGYDGRENLQDAWPSYIPTAGYRVITMANNRIANYTYDMDGDGARDASYAHPLFDFTTLATTHNPMLNFTLAYNPLNFSAGATCAIFNNLTETIQAARAAIVLPINSTHRWQPIPGPITVHERARFSNGTHEFIDLRLRVAARSTATIQLQFSLT